MYKECMWSNVKRSMFVICLLLIFDIFVIPNYYQVKAEKDAVNAPIYLLEMPNEQIDYTIYKINGKLWAKVDGTYPLNKININSSQSHAFLSPDILHIFTGEKISMLYPTPPGTKNISIKIDEVELGWSNYTQKSPEALHCTAIGNWSMISCTLDPVLDEFTLKIHYEHPIEQNNGSHMFLYDINITPYLSPWSNKSTAFFTIKFETKIAGFQAATITTQGIMKSVEYTTQQNLSDKIFLQVVSEYSKPVLGDLLISFSDNEETEKESLEVSDSNMQFDHISIILTVGSSVALALMGYFLVRRSKGDDSVD